MEIKFVRRDSGLVMPRDKTTGAADCRVSLSSVSRKAGVVRSLSHGLASNTTCTWEFQVRSRGEYNAFSWARIDLLFWGLWDFFSTFCDWTYVFGTFLNLFSKFGHIFGLF